MATLSGGISQGYAGSGALLCFHQWPGREHQTGADQKCGYIKVTPCGEA